MKKITVSVSDELHAKLKNLISGAEFLSFREIITTALLLLLAQISKEATIAEPKHREAKYFYRNIEYENKIMTLEKWSEELKIPLSTLRYRLEKSNGDIEKAFGGKWKMGRPKGSFKKKRRKNG